MNWIDLVIILIIGFFIWDGFHRGFLKTAWELVGLILAFLLGLRFYLPASNLLAAIHMPQVFTKPIAFLTIWILTQIFFYFIGRLIAFYTPTPWKESKINHFTGTVPGTLKGIIFVAVVLVFLIIMPIGNSTKNIINHSYFSVFLIKETALIENQIEQVFSGQTTIMTLTNLSTTEDSTTALGFSTTNFNIDEAGEEKMLEKINTERSKVGLPILKSDILVRNVARAHSRDMLLKGYFSHTSSDGQTVFSRLTLAKVNFQEAAENLALAPTIDLAQIGLMNSPKHKANILDPDFTRMGIGIIDAGPYGLMITQDFVK